MHAALMPPAVPRRGRPPGAVKPLTRWIRNVIWEMRRDGFGEAEVFRRLLLAEEAADDGHSFVITQETADECWLDVGADLAGQRVSWQAFRSAWRRANF